MKRKMNKAFTLAELLVVVAVLALIGTLALTLTDGVEERSQENVSVANQAAVLKSVQTYLTMNGGNLNNLDSLLRVDVPAEPAGTLVLGTDEAENTAGIGIYTGITQRAGDTDFSDPAVLEKAQVNKGLYGASNYAIYYLSSRISLGALNSIGVTNIYDHSYGSGHPKLLNPSRGTEDYTCNYDSYDANTASYEGPTFRIEASANWCRTITSAYTYGVVDADGNPVFEDDGVTQETATAGQPILIISPEQTDIYKRYGLTIVEPAGESVTASDWETALENTGYVLGVFGLGGKCTVVGGKGGINAVPKCGLLDRAYYPYFLLVVKIPLSPSDFKAHVVGVLNSKGQSIESAQFYTDWRHGS